MRATFASLFVFLLGVVLIPSRAQLPAQRKPAGKTSTHSSPSKSSQVERGRYIVESVAMCEQCHTERDHKGNPDRAHWLMGGSITMRPAYDAPVWAQREPRLAG